MILLDLSQTDPRTLPGINIDDHFYVCRQCRVKLTEQDYLFCVAGNRSFHTFKNPAGFEYNILTFTYCASYREISLPMEQDTWFPGYYWIVINCQECNTLLGWKYMAVKDESSIFFGLIREQILLV